MAKTIASGVGMTNDWLASQGVLSLKTLWAELAQLRGTAAALLCVEPTRPDPHARWCGEGARKRASLADFWLFVVLVLVRSWDDTMSARSMRRFDASLQCDGPRIIGITACGMSR